MATYLDLVEKLLLYTEKIPIAEATEEQQNLALRDVNDAVRYVYNNGDLSFKTVILRDFGYAAYTPGDVSKGSELPANFMGFHQTGKVYLQAYPERGGLIYEPYHRIIELTEGPLSTRTGIPTHYGLGGPSDAESGSNQRELLLWPRPTEDPTLLTLVYQCVAPADIEDIGDADVEIPRIPATWHVPVILAMAKVFRKMDKGADDSMLSKTLATAIKQMNIQEPHGREKPRHRPVHPAWRY